VTGNNNPTLCIGGPKDGSYFTIDSAYRSVHVRELARGITWAPSSIEQIPEPIRTQTHIYHRERILGEEFLVHDSLRDSPEFPRNFMAALKNGYKVIK
jgi:hypothetical protein